MLSKICGFEYKMINNKKLHQSFTHASLSFKGLPTKFIHVVFIPWNGLQQLSRLHGLLGLPGSSYICGWCSPTSVCPWHSYQPPIYYIATLKFHCHVVDQFFLKLANNMTIHIINELLLYLTKHLLFLSLSFNYCVKHSLHY